jgi:hypothetical protein
MNAILLRMQKEKFPGIEDLIWGHGHVEIFRYFTGFLNKWWYG